MKRWPYSRNRNQAAADSPTEMEAALEVADAPQHLHPSVASPDLNSTQLAAGLSSVEDSFHHDTSISSASTQHFLHHPTMRTAAELTYTTSSSQSYSSSGEDTAGSSSAGLHVQTLAPSWIEWFVNAKDFEPVCKDEPI